MSLTTNYFVVALNNKEKKVLIFERKSNQIMIQTDIPLTFSCMKLLESLLVIGDYEGTLTLFNISMSMQPKFLQDKSQTTVDSFDCNNQQLVVSCESKFIVWNLFSDSIEKIINRPGKLTILGDNSEVVAQYPGPKVSLSYPIVVSPSLGPDYGLEIWDIELAQMINKIDAYFDYFTLRFPLINLETSHSMVMNTVYNIDGESPKILQCFTDERMEEMSQTEGKHDKHTIFTQFHHITLGKNLNEFDEYGQDGLSKLILRSLKPQ